MGCFLAFFFLPKQIISFYTPERAIPFHNFLEHCKGFHSQADGCKPQEKNSSEFILLIRPAERKSAFKHGGSHRMRKSGKVEQYLTLLIMLKIRTLNLCTFWEHSLLFFLTSNISSLFFKVLHLEKDNFSFYLCLQLFLIYFNAEVVTQQNFLYEYQPYSQE